MIRSTKAVDGSLGCAEKRGTGVGKRRRTVVRVVMHNVEHDNFKVPSASSFGNYRVSYSVSEDIRVFITSINLHLSEPSRLECLRLARVRTHVSKVCSNACESARRVKAYSHAWLYVARAGMRVCELEPNKCCKDHHE